MGRKRRALHSRKFANKYSRKYGIRRQQPPTVDEEVVPVQPPTVDEEVVPVVESVVSTALEPAPEPAPAPAPAPVIEVKEVVEPPPVPVAKPVRKARARRKPAIKTEKKVDSES